MSGHTSDIGSYHKLVSWTPSGTAFSPCKGVIATTAGTIDCIDADGNSLTALPVAVGSNPYQLTKISAASASLGLFIGY